MPWQELSCGANYTSKGSCRSLPYAGNVHDAINVTLNGEALTATANVSRLYVSSVPDFDSDLMVAWDVPATIPRDGHNALVVKVVNASGVPGCISACHSAYAKIVHIDLQMPVEAH